MTAPQWAADPYGRAELRYWDGAGWTSHVSTGGRQWDEQVVAASFAPPGFAPPSPAGVSARPRVNGLLRAAGIMGIIQGSLALLIGLWIISAAQSDVGRWVDNASGGTLTFIGILVLAVGGGVLAAGIGSVRGRSWGRITLIVFESIFLLVTLAGISSSDSGGGSVGGLLYTGTVLGLAIFGR